MNSTKKRAEYSIIETFLSLLAQMPIEKITVKKIVEATKINRRTFYDYFYSKENLIDIIDTQILNDFQSIFGEFKETEIQHARKLVEQRKPLPHNIAICEHIQQHQHYYLHRFKDEAFGHKFTQIITNYLADLSQDTDTSMYLAYGTIGYLKNWLHSNCSKPISEVAIGLANAGFHTVIRQSTT